MEGLKAKEREKLIDRIISLNTETRLYVVKIAPIDVVIEMALKENDDDVLDIIFKRLDAEKEENEEIKNIFVKFPESKSWKIRKSVAKIASIKTVCQMALREKDKDVLEVILRRLDEEKYSEEVKSIVDRLVENDSWKIRDFTAKIAPIKTVCQMALKEQDKDVLETILIRLEEEKDSEEVKRIVERLAENSYWKIRNFAAKVVPIKYVCKMVLYEQDYDVLETILRRLNKDKDSEEVKLTKNEYWEVYKFVITTIPIKIVCKVAKYARYEDYQSKMKILEEEKDSEEVKRFIKKVSENRCCKIRNFAAKVVPIKYVCQMVLDEQDKDVLETILRRLNEEKNSKEVKNIVYRLAKNEFWKIRDFAAKIVSIKMVCQMALNEQDKDVLETILGRLDKEKDSEEVKSIVDRLVENDYWKIRDFAAKIVPIKYVCKMALKEQDKDVLETILRRLEKEKDSEEVKNILYKLIEAKSVRVYKFVLGILPIEKLEEIINFNRKSRKVIKTIHQMNK